MNEGKVCIVTAACPKKNSTAITVFILFYFLLIKQFFLNRYLKKKKKFKGYNCCNYVAMHSSFPCLKLSADLGRFSVTAVSRGAALGLLMS